MLKQQHYTLAQVKIAINHPLIFFTLSFSFYIFTAKCVKYNQNEIIHDFRKTDRLASY